ncbi:MAG: rhodanese-like domain-containing protein [Bacteroidales bacterium]|nr:rhodanese-like domain-containing protein [Bacteroidales bacterium]
MSRKYIIPVALLLILSIVLVLLPRKQDHSQMSPEELLRQINSTSRFVSTDEVADRLIRKDPSLALIDVRNDKLFSEYSLPGSLNIPVDNILADESQEILSQEGLEFVFYSTDDILADQTWIILKRKGLKNIYVLKGGLNEWFRTFFTNPPPAETADSEEFALYQFRMGVRQYFTGTPADSPEKSSAEKIIVTPKKKKSAAEGGC